METYRTCVHLLEKAIRFHDYYYSLVEERILEGEKSQRYKIKKSILLYHCYLIILFCIIMPFFSPESLKLKSLGFIVLTVCQIFILRSKNYDLIGSYVYLHAMMILAFEYMTDGEPLIIIGTILANQHMFFLFPENKLLSKMYIPTIIILFRNMLNKLIQNIASWNTNYVEMSLRSLYYCWPIILFFHYCGAKNLTSSYRLALIENMKIQEDLKKALSDLEKSNEDLKAALQARELFIASVSHEFRNPLNSMLGNLELLRLEVKNEKWLKMLETCKMCSEVLLGQINNVLDVAKINAEKLELHSVPGNFHALIERAWNISSLSIKQKNIHGELKISKDFPKYVKMDSHRLTQILLNLIGNATKFTKEGFVHVTISWHTNESIEDLRKPSQEYMRLVNSKKRPSLFSASKGLRSEEDIYIASLEFADTTEKRFAIEGVMQREFSTKLISQVLNTSNEQSTSEDFGAETKFDSTFVYSPHEKGIIRIDIVDTGCGISSESLKELFKPFKQADPSITRQFGGTGLGLYITKQIIQKMGGEILAFSSENIGSNFSVLIPAETANKEDVKEEQPSSNTTDQVEIIERKKELRALVVDDTIDNQLILSSFLKKLGITSDIANNGLEAVNMVKSKEPNYYMLITMDIQMPIMDGLRAIRLIRDYEQSIRAKSTPIIVITANCAETEKTKCLDLNGDIRAYKFFRKPFTFDECRSTVRSIIAEQEALYRSLKLNPKVLIIDNDPFSTIMTQEYLEKNGFKASICTTGREAITKMAQEVFDVIIIDCEIAEMDYYSAVQNVRRLYPGVLIIGLTGNRREECLKRSLENGMFGVETKPINFSSLLNLILRGTNQRR